MVSVNQIEVVDVRILGADQSFLEAESIFFQDLLVTYIFEVTDLALWG